MLSKLSVSRRGWAIARYILLFLCFSILAKADSRVSVYILWALAAGAAAIDNHHKDHRLTSGHRILILGACCLFGLMVTLANYSLFLPFSTTAMLNGLLVMGGAAVSAWELLLWLCCRLPVELTRPLPGKWTAGRVFAVSFVFCVSISLAYLVFVAWPGGLSEDSNSQLLQIHYNGYTNHHPYWHTQIIRLLLNLGVSLFGTMNAGVATYSVAQACFMAACFSYAVMTLWQMGLPKGWILGVMAAYALIPYHIVYATLMWKDIPFSGTVLLFAVALVRCVKDIGRGNLPMLFLTGVGCCVLRSNGLLAAAVSTVILIPCLGKKHWKTLALLALAIVCGWTLKSPVLAWMNVYQPDLVESLSIPVQQVARVITEGAELTPEEEALLSRVVDLEEVPTLYEWHISDPIKDEIRSKDPAYFEENIHAYRDLWIQLGLRYPDGYLRGWIDQTKGYWNGGYDYWVFPRGWIDNIFDITWTGGGNLPAKVFEKYIWFFEVMSAFQWMHSIGLHLWAAVLLALVAIVRRRPEGWCLLPVILIIATLWVATPVSSEFRYAYCLFTVLPFAAPAIMGRVKE